MHTSNRQVITSESRFANAAWECLEQQQPTTTSASKTAEPPRYAPAHHPKLPSPACRETLYQVYTNRNPESSRYPRVPRYLSESAAHRADVRCVTLGFDILLPFALAWEEENPTRATEIVKCYEQQEETCLLFSVTQSIHPPSEENTTALIGV